MQEESSTDEMLFDEKKSDEDVSVDIPKERRKIYFETPTRRVKEIYHTYKTNDLDPRPDFQRGYVWDQRKASRLIESVLLNVPIPPSPGIKSKTVESKLEVSRLFAKCSYP